MNYQMKKNIYTESMQFKEITKDDPMIMKHRKKRYEKNQKQT